MRRHLSALFAAAAVLSSSGLAFQREQDPERPWTLMIYGAADNNADGPILEFLDRIRGALDDDPGMQMVLFLDRSERYSTDAKTLGEDFTGARVYRLRKDSAERLDASTHFAEMKEDDDPELDSADPRTLGRFVAFCKDRFPARRYGLLIYGHANGAFMCPDDTSGTDMGIPALSDRVGAEASVDFLALELCNMGGIEIAYQWRPGNGGFSAEVMVAIPNAGIPLDWDRAFARIRSKGHGTSANGPALDPDTMTALDFGRLVIEEGQAGRLAHLERAVRAGLLDLENPAHLEKVREAAGCYDLRAVEGAKQAIDKLAVALAEGDHKEAVEELRGATDDERMMNYAARGKFDARPYVDAYELLDLVAASEKLDEAARSAARQARDTVDEVVVVSFGMEKVFEGFEPGRNGLFMVFPDGDAVVPRDGGSQKVWAGLSWYTPLSSAVSGTAYGGWAFLADGATPDNSVVENWFELLDCWFDDRSMGPEGLNRYAW